MFGARPSDALDLLDAISDPQAETLRRLLDGDNVQLKLEEHLVPGPVRLVVTQDTAEVPLSHWRAPVVSTLRFSVANGRPTDLRTARHRRGHRC